MQALLYNYTVISQIRTVLLVAKMQKFTHNSYLCNVDSYCCSFEVCINEV